MNLHAGIAGVVKIFLVAVLVVLPCAYASQSQGDMNRAACADQKDAEQKLNKVYAQILAKHHADKAFIEYMKQSQRAWLAYRKAKVNSLYPHRNSAEYGTVYPMCHCSGVAEMTVARVRELEQWTEGIEIGDVCTGTRSLKQ